MRSCIQHLTIHNFWYFQVHIKWFKQLSDKNILSFFKKSLREEHLLQMVIQKGRFP